MHQVRRLQNSTHGIPYAHAMASTDSGRTLTARTRATVDRPRVCRGLLCSMCCVPVHGYVKRRPVRVKGGQSLVSCKEHAFQRAQRNMHLANRPWPAAQPYGNMSAGTPRSSQEITASNGDVDAQHQQMQHTRRHCGRRCSVDRISDIGRDHFEQQRCGSAGTAAAGR